MQAWRDDPGLTGTARLRRPFEDWFALIPWQGHGMTPTYWKDIFVNIVRVGNIFM